MMSIARLDGISVTGLLSNKSGRAPVKAVVRCPEDDEEAKIMASIARLDLRALKLQHTPSGSKSGSVCGDSVASPKPAKGPASVASSTPKAGGYRNRKLVHSAQRAKREPRATTTTRSVPRQRPASERPQARSNAQGKVYVSPNVNIRELLGL